jgi:hypothetical protein
MRTKKKPNKTNLSLITIKRIRSKINRETSRGRKPIFPWENISGGSEKL